MRINKIFLSLGYTFAFFTATVIVSCSSSDGNIDVDEELIIIEPDPEEEPIDPDKVIVSDYVASTSIECNDEFNNPDRNQPDVTNAANDGLIDDRSCYSNYSENLINGTYWGVYNISEGSNQFGGTLQPRIERALDKAKTSAVGSYVRLTGKVRILETGKTSSYGNDGTYIMQAKGTHGPDANGNQQGSAEPAICLFLAKPVMATDQNGIEYQKSFRIYREQITRRGGEGTGGTDPGRTIVYLTEVQKGEITEIEFEVGFKVDPNDSSKKIHYADATIGGTLFPFVIPEPERGLQSGIRYGAYRIKGGKAQIRWADTTYERQE